MTQPTSTVPPAPCRAFRATLSLARPESSVTGTGSGQETFHSVAVSTVSTERWVKQLVFIVNSSFIHIVSATALIHRRALSSIPAISSLNSERSA